MSQRTGGLDKLCRAPCWHTDAAGLLPTPKGPSEAVGFAVGSVTSAYTGQSGEEEEYKGQKGRIGMTNPLATCFLLCPSVQPTVSHSPRGTEVLPVCADCMT